MEIRLAETIANAPKIKVIGVGGCGCNSIHYLIEKQISDIDYICINTDAQNLKAIQGSGAHLVQIGSKLTKGQGAGGNPEIGYLAALEDKELIKDALFDTDLVFITAGMGGGTGTGASELIASTAKELGILTVSIIYQPFVYERGRIEIAKTAAKKLASIVDTQVVILNQKLSELAAITSIMAYDHGYKVLENAVTSITDIITIRGQVNLDFADVRSVIQARGGSIISSGFAIGENSALEALDNAINCSIIENIDLTNISKLLINITSNRKLKQTQLNKLFERIYNETPDTCSIFSGHVYDDKLENDAVKISLIINGVVNENSGNSIKEREQEREQEKTPTIKITEKKIATATNIDDAITKKALNKSNKQRTIKPASKSEGEFAQTDLFNIEAANAKPTGAWSKSVAYNNLSSNRKFAD